MASARGITPQMSHIMKVVSVRFLWIASNRNLLQLDRRQFIRRLLRVSRLKERAGKLGLEKSRGQGASRTQE